MIKSAHGVIAIEPTRKSSRAVPSKRVNAECWVVHQSGHRFQVIGPTGGSEGVVCIHLTQGDRCALWDGGAIQVRLFNMHGYRISRFFAYSAGRSRWNTTTAVFPGVQTKIREKCKFKIGT